MTDGRDAPQLGLDGGRHGAELALAGEQLAEGVADVHDIDVARCDPGGGERLAHGLGEQLGESDLFARGVAREVGLIAAEHCHGHTVISTVVVGVRQTLRSTCRIAMPARKMHGAARVADYTRRGWWTDETVQQLFADQVRTRGAALAVVDPPNKAELVDLPPRRLSWAELGEQVDRLAATLLDYGIGEGDVLAVQLPNIAELVIAYLAAWRVRAIVSPLPVQYRRHELESLGRVGSVPRRADQRPHR